MRTTLIAAQSLDGFITRHDIPGSAFASEADRAFFRTALASFDSCIMGAKTYQTARDAIRRGLMPDRLRMVLSRTPEAFLNDVIPGKLEFTRLAPAELTSELEHRGCRHCALLGGSQIHSLFLEAGLVDELWLTIEPLLFGSGTSLLGRKANVDLELLSHENLSSQTLLLKYRVRR